MSSAKNWLGEQWAADRPPARMPAASRPNVQSLAVADIEGDPEQPRRHFDEEQLRELGESIQAHGQLQPIRVRPVGVSGRYMVVAGERRLRASKLVGLERIDAIIVSERVDIDTVRVEQAVENLQRADLTPLEEAEHFARLISAWGCSQAELARRLRKGTATISRALALLAPPEDKPAPRPRRRKVAPTDKRRAATYETRAAGTVRVKRGYSLEQLVDELRQVLEAERRADAA
jgi:ParB/RepB/Spo0J family partition protein